MVGYKVVFFSFIVLILLFVRCFINVKDSEYMGYNMIGSLWNEFIDNRILKF